MLKEILLDIYVRDLIKLKNEINLYTDEANLWIKTDEIPNSAGNLTLHLLGNLNHYFGALLDKNGYVRERNREFIEQNVLLEDLNQRIDTTIEVVKTTLNNLTDEDFAADYPETLQGKVVKTDFFITHSTTHFNYHLGQINYHRRLLG